MFRIHQHLNRSEHEDLCLLPIYGQHLKTKEPTLSWWQLKSSAKTGLFANLLISKYKLADFLERCWGLGQNCKIRWTGTTSPVDFLVLLFQVYLEAAVSTMSQRSRKHNQYAGITLLNISSMSSEMFSIFWNLRKSSYTCLVNIARWQSLKGFFFFFFSPEGVILINGILLISFL